MIGIIPASLAFGRGVPTLIGASALLSGVGLTRASKGWALGANGTTWGEILTDQPRFHGTARRLLVEGARTNGVRNPRAEGAATGSPGTVPANWSMTGPTGIARNVIGAGTEDGLPYVDLQFVGTSATSSAISVFPETSAAIAAAQGQVWTAAIFMSVLPGGTGLTNVGTPSILIREYTAGTQSTSGSTTIPLATGALGTSRKSAVRLLSTAGLTNVLFTPNFPVAANAAIDLRLRLACPQMEQAIFASTPILPPAGSPAAATRAADAPALSLSGSAPSQGTALIRAMIPQSAPAGVDQGLFQLDDGTDGNRVVLRNLGGGNTVQAAILSGGTTLATLAGGSMTGGTPFRAALAWDAAGTSLCLSGGTVVTTGSARPAGLTRLLIGHGSTALNRALNGEIEFLTLQPNRLPDDAVQALANPT